MPVGQKRVARHHAGMAGLRWANRPVNRGWGTWMGIEDGDRGWGTWMGIEDGDRGWGSRMGIEDGRGQVRTGEDG